MSAEGPFDDVVPAPAAAQALRVVCCYAHAGCLGPVLAEGAPGAPVSHGICLPCATVERARRAAAARSRFDADVLGAMQRAREERR